MTSLKIFANSILKNQTMPDVRPTEHIAREPFSFVRINDIESVSENRLDACHARKLTDTDTILAVYGLDKSDISLSSYHGIQATKSKNLDVLTIRDCNRSRIVVDIPLGSLHVFNCSECSITICGVRGSVHVQGCEKSAIAGFCGQLRLTECFALDISVQTNSSCALSSSRAIKIHRPPDVISVDAITPCLIECGLFSEDFFSSSKWMNVKDFDCLHGQSPNWIIVPP
jgi:hypothetical protein